MHQRSQTSWNVSKNVSFFFRANRRGEESLERSENRKEGWKSKGPAGSVVVRKISGGGGRGRDDGAVWRSVSPVNPNLKF